MCTHDDHQFRPVPPSSTPSFILMLTLLSIAIITAAALVFDLSHILIHLPSFSTFLSVSFLVFVALITVLVYHMLTFPDRQLHPPAPPPSMDTARSHFQSNSSALSRRLAAALSIPTISHDDVTQSDRQQFSALHQHLRTAYPLVHQHSPPAVINQHSLLYHFPGSDISLLPVLLLAHLDVVPVPDSAHWLYPPFSGHISSTHIHGRGAIDDKNNVCAQLEVMEHILSQRSTLRRSVYLAYGHDEEVGGNEGAKRIGQHLNEKGVKFAFSLDEGLFVLNGMIPGYPRAVAMICTGEKGQVTVEVEVEVKASDAGHSSVPGRQSAIALLGQSLVRLHNAVMPSYFGVRDRQMMEWLAPGFPFPLRLVMTNLWLFAPLVRFIMSRKPQTAATLRTTTALTVVRAGEKVNVVPVRATGLVNHRVHPRDSVEGVVEFDRRVVGEGVKVTKKWANEASPRSSVDNDGWRAVHESVMTVFPHVSVAPTLMVAGTDSRHYEELCEAQFRFSAIELSKDELSQFHGRDESISIENYVRLTLFYYTLITKCDGMIMRCDQQELSDGDKK